MVSLTFAYSFSGTGAPPKFWVTSLNPNLEPEYPQAIFFNQAFSRFASQSGNSWFSPMHFLTF